MQKIKYLIQFILILILFLINKLLGLNYSLIFSGKIFSFFGPLFRSNNVSNNNLKKALNNSNQIQRKKF